MGWIWSQPLYFYDLSEQAAYDDVARSVSRTLDAVRKKQASIVADVTARANGELAAVTSGQRYAIVERMFELSGEDAGKAFISRRRPPAVVRDSLARPPDMPL